MENYNKIEQFLNLRNLSEKEIKDINYLYDLIRNEDSIGEQMGVEELYQVIKKYQSSNQLNNKCN